jgi:hypothetical protein
LDGSNIKNLISSLPFTTKTQGCYIVFASFVVRC